jgi:hypothetical protein
VANKTGNRLVIPLSLVQATRMIARGWKAAESLAGLKQAGQLELVAGEHYPALMTTEHP